MLITFQFQFVFIGIYAIDREYIYPAKLDEFNPQLLNPFGVRKQFWMVVLCIDEVSLFHPSLPLSPSLSLPLPLSFLLSLPPPPPPLSPLSLSSFPLLPSLPPSLSLPSFFILPPSAHHHNHTSTARSTPCLPSLSKDLQCSGCDIHCLHYSYLHFIVCTMKCLHRTQK